MTLKRPSITFAVLLALYLLTFGTREAKAYGTVSSLSFDDDTGGLSGYSATWVDWTDGYDECTDWEEDFEDELDYCAVEEYGIPWGSLYGTLNSPTEMYSTDSTWDYSYAEIDYSATPGTFGTWGAVGDHYLGEDNYVVQCYDDEGDCDPDEAEGPSWEELPGTSATALARPIISTSGNEVWYFAGYSPSNYPTSITLTSSGGSSTTWTVTANSTMVHLSTSSGSSITVTASGNAFSSSIGDVTITATANGVASRALSMTTATPTTITPAGTINQCPDPSLTGYMWLYLTNIYYTVQDNFGNTMLPAMPFNEYFPAGATNDYSGTNWVQSAMGLGGDTASGYFIDQVGGELSWKTPTPNCTGGTTPVQHWPQEWFFGSYTNGQGWYRQTDTIQKYTGYAEHTDIINP